MLGSILSSQQDSSYLDYDRLAWSDLDYSSTDSLKTKIISGTRTERNLEDIPFTVFVITAEEIREQGYHTLVDALRHLPGIRVSQPASAMDGESFMMRGLYGNTYAKILINDIPVKPSGVGAMPIGSQLPIRQAERIEVIYGPAATLYGSDAAAGVINIILKESDYPTFAQADIEVGQNNHSRVNALFGGRFTIGNKTLKLNMYGGYTNFIDRNIKYDQATLYNPSIYEDFIKENYPEVISYQGRPNYVGTESQALLSNIPHQSNYIGFLASFGAFEFSTSRMFRADHSSIGLNPLAVSYADPQNLFGEEILTTSLVFKKNYKKWNFKIKASTLDYSINPLSSYKYVLPTLGVISNLYVSNQLALPDLSAASQSIDSLYLTGSRYVSGSSSDVSLDAQFSFEISKTTGISVGLQSLGGFAKDGIERYKELPGTARSEFVAPTVLSNSNFLFSENIAFAEAYFDLGSLYAVVGAQIFAREDSLVRDDPQFNPRLGILYKLDSFFSIRSSFTTAFRYPSSFFSASSYSVGESDDFINITSGSLDLEPESTLSFEAGIRFRRGNKFNLDASIYYTRTRNFINYVVRRNATENSLIWGYQNDPNSFSRLYGAQLNLQMNNLWPAIKLRTNVSLNYSKGKEKLIPVDLSELGSADLYTLPVIRAQPDFMAHLRTTFDAGKHLRFTLNHTFITDSWTRNKLRITQALAQNNTESVIIDGYYNLNLRSIFSVSRQLSVYLNFHNLFNNTYAGIDASYEPDILLYNPQSQFMAMFGVNYSFN